MSSFHFISPSTFFFNPSLFSLFSPSCFISSRPPPLADAWRERISADPLPSSLSTSSQPARSEAEAKEAAAEAEGRDDDDDDDGGSDMDADEDDGGPPADSFSSFSALANQAIASAKPRRKRARDANGALLPQRPLDADAGDRPPHRPKPAVVVTLPYETSGQARGEADRRAYIDKQTLGGDEAGAGTDTPGSPAAAAAAASATTTTTNTTTAATTTADASGDNAGHTASTQHAPDGDAQPEKRAKLAESPGHDAPPAPGVSSPPAAAPAAPAPKQASLRELMLSRSASGAGASSSSSSSSSPSAKAQGGAVISSSSAAGLSRLPAIAGARGAHMSALNDDPRLLLSSSGNALFTVAAPDLPARPVVRFTGAIFDSR